MTLPAYHSVFTALHENSRAFEQYLASENFQAALDEANLRRKPKHTILAHVRPLFSFAYSELFLMRFLYSAFMLRLRPLGLRYPFFKTKNRGISECV
jgi:hypothetical protein